MARISLNGNHVVDMDTRVQRMADLDLDLYMDATSRALGLQIKDQWRAAVRANLKVSLDFCRQVDDFEFDDRAEPAPVFVA